MEVIIVLLNTCPSKTNINAGGTTSNQWSIINAFRIKPMENVFHYFRWSLSLKPYRSSKIIFLVVFDIIKQQNVCCFSYFYWIQTNTFLFLSPVLGRYLWPRFHKLVEFAVEVLSKWTEMIDFDFVFCTKKEVEIKIGLTTLGPQSFKHICCPLLRLSSAALSTL